MTCRSVAHLVREHLKIEEILAAFENYLLLAESSPRPDRHELWELVDCLSESLLIRHEEKEETSTSPGTHPPRAELERRDSCPRAPRASARPLLTALPPLLSSSEPRLERRELAPLLIDGRRVDRLHSAPHGSRGKTPLPLSRH